MITLAAKSTFVLLLLVNAMPIFSQHLIKGKVTNQEGDPIPFVSIGITNTYVGTISELDGGFELKIPKNLTADNLAFSSIGYQSTSISLAASKGMFLDIVLIEDVRRLSEVVVASKRLRAKVKRRGKVHSMDSRFMTDPNYSGSALAQLIVSPFDTTQIRWISLGYLNKIKDLQLRVQFHGVNENGQPGEVIFGKEIIVDLYEFAGEHKMKFDDFVFVTDKEFFVVLEPLVLQKNRTALVETIDGFLEDSPEYIELKDDGEFVVNNNYLDLNFFQFAVSSTKKGTAFYRTSSFDKWYDSEELSLVTGILDINEDLGFTVDRVETEFAKAPTSVDVYEHTAGFSYSTVADYLRRVGGLTVQGKGEDVKVYVRGGASTMLGDNEPIFIIDGVHVGRGYDSTVGLSPIQIKSVEVLRGPIETARYGSIGAKGVVVIRTVNQN